MALVKYRGGLRLSRNLPRLRFASYLGAAALPSVPSTFGHGGLIAPDAWGMLGNNSVKNCTIAGPDHAIMLWNKIAGRDVSFTTTDAIDDYKVFGYDGTPETDNGCSMDAVAAFWKKIGMRDSAGKRHQIAAYLQIDAGNAEHIFAAGYFFELIGLGVDLPTDAESTFDAGQPWDAGNPSGDLHFVPLIGRGTFTSPVVTWGAEQPVTQRFVENNVREAIAFLTEEDLVNGRSVEGFDFASLQSDLMGLRS